MEAENETIPVMEDNITVIAGANNSGKTSLVELFNGEISQGGYSGRRMPQMEWPGLSYICYRISICIDGEKDFKYKVYQ